MVAFQLRGETTLIDYRDHKGRPFDPATRPRPAHHLGHFNGKAYDHHRGVHVTELARRQAAKGTARDLMQDFLAFLGLLMVMTGGACLLIAAVEARASSWWPL